MRTLQYSQPKYYQHSLDPVQAAAWIAKDLVAKNLQVTRLLDLCAGCGVFGYEILWNLPGIKEAHFVELQMGYKEHLEENALRLKRARPDLDKVKISFHLQEMRKTQWGELQNQFDLIVANPPYFLRGNGPVAENLFLQKCLYLDNSTFADLWDLIDRSLASQGRAFVLMRNMAEHKVQLLDQVYLRYRYRGRVQVETSLGPTDLISLSF